jgi:Tfp pilus assembly protein PilF
VHTTATEANDWLEQAHAYRGRAQYPEAVDAYARALELAPDLAPAAAGRGQILHAAGFRDQALADFEQALRHDPLNASALYGRGLIRHQRDDVEGALDDFTRALALDPEHTARYRRRLGMVYHGLQQHDRALAEYAASIEHDPDQADAYYFRALCYDEMKRTQHALDDLTHALELAPGWPMALAARSAIYARQWQYRRAYDDIVAAGQHDKRVRSERAYLWMMAHPIRFMLGLIALLMFGLFVLLSMMPNPVAPNRVVEITGSFASIEIAERGQLALRLANQPGRFMIETGDQPFFDLASFQQQVRPGDILSLSVLSDVAERTQPEASLVTLQIRSNTTIFMTLEPVAESRRQEAFVILSVGLIASLIVLVVSIAPLLRSPWTAGPAI